MKLEITTCAIGGAGVLCYLAHAVFDHVQNSSAESTDSALQLAHIRHHIGGFARVNHRHRNDRRLDRFFVARHDGLESHDHLTRHRHGVDPVVGQGGMATLAVNGDFEFVAGGHHRSGAHRKRAAWVTWPVVHAKHGVHGEQIEQSVLDHGSGPTATLFSRLENQVNRSVEIAVLGQVLGRRQQHGRVSIVATGVHAAREPTAMLKGVELCHGQGIHIGPEAHATSTSASVAAMHNAHHAGFSQASMNRYAPIGQGACHQV